MNNLFRGVLLPGALDLASFNEILSVFLYNRKSKSGCSVHLGTWVVGHDVVTGNNLFFLNLNEVFSMKNLISLVKNKGY